MNSLINPADEIFSNEEKSNAVRFMILLWVSMKLGNYVPMYRWSDCPLTAIGFKTLRKKPLSPTVAPDRRPIHITTRARKARYDYACFIANLEWE
jgi:hypothetical protein